MKRKINSDYLFVGDDNRQRKEVFKINERTNERINEKIIFRINNFFFFPEIVNAIKIVKILGKRIILCIFFSMRLERKLWPDKIINLIILISNKSKDD